MRFRSFCVSASNMEEYLSKLKVQETEYLEESTLSQLNYISIEPKINEDDDNKDDYALLGHKSSYRVQRINFRKKRRKRRRINSNQYFRKKIYFHHKRKRINSEQCDINITKKSNIWCLK